MLRYRQESNTGLDDSYILIGQYTVIAAYTVDFIFHKIKNTLPSINKDLVVIYINFNLGTVFLQVAMKSCN